MGIVEYIRWVEFTCGWEAFKINAKIEDVGLTEDLKGTETRNGH